ncbi:hypothetical protein PPACK8108_LOCUS9490 [Phakopsora pachyrhizi]|uniref:RING-type domain-containing protein n=1 Tax=Phakopsora pachyrhizi TaxID=170000 RepID=A0AAV0AY68_PHAPC|nr:hypothetical protein PPACK8108_LOCUS9490 [Phakopsora pachyrhizi]
MANDPCDTFYQSLELSLDEPVGCLSISPENRDVVLGARKGLFVIDLNHPYEPPRYLAHSATWDVADIQWSPHPERRSWVASTSSQKALIWNLDLPYHSQFSSQNSASLDATLQPRRTVQSPIQFVLEAHTRAICDINWSVFNVDVLATCGIDSWTYVFDLRTGGSAAVQGFCAWTSPATQVKWNRQDPHLLATSHNSYVFIWDTRKPGTPYLKFKAHDEKIYGIDWSRRSADGLVTCSLDKSVKFWSANSPEFPVQTINTPSPVRRARHLPFGRGVMTLPQRLDHVLKMWSQDAPSSPIALFSGHSDTVREFVWRTRGGNDLGYDDRQFQLVTWGNDRKLRLWPIGSDVLEKAGFNPGAPIDVRVTRKAVSSNRSFRHSSLTVPFVPSPPAMSVSPLKPGKMSHPSSVSSASANRMSPVQLVSPRSRAVTMSEGVRLNQFHSHKAHQARMPTIRSPGFMTRRTIHRFVNKPQHKLNWMEGVRLYQPTPDSEKVGVQSESIKVSQTRSLSPEGGRKASNVTQRPANSTVPLKLGEELTAVQRNFPRVTFEQVSVQARTCTVCFRGPWAARGEIAFVRATFTFPKFYPELKPPSIEIERSPDFSAKTRAYLLKSARELMQDQVQIKKSGVLDVCLRFLLGDKFVLRKAERFADSDEEIRDADGGTRFDLWQNDINIPAQRKAGLCFSPYGHIISFYCGDLPTAQTSKTALALPNRNYKFEAFGIMAISPPDGEIRIEEESESDEDLRLSTYRQPKNSNHTQAAISPVLSRQLSTILNVRQLRILKPAPVPLLESFNPVDIVTSSLNLTMDHDDIRHHTWKMTHYILEGIEEFSEKFIDQTSTIFSELLRRLRDIHDIETLGYIGCVIELVRRSKKFSTSAKSNSISLPLATPTDYFNSKVVKNDRPSASSGSLQTPEVTTGSSQSPSKGSWSNFFLSLTQATSLSNPTPIQKEPAFSAQSCSAPTPSPDRAVAMLKQQLAGNHGGIDSSSKRDLRTQPQTFIENILKKTSINSTSLKVNCESVAVRPAPRRKRVLKVKDCCKSDKEPTSILDDEKLLRELEEYKHLLCELLMRRELFVERTMVVKMLRTDRSADLIKEGKKDKSNSIENESLLETSDLCTSCGAWLRRHQRVCEECGTSFSKPCCTICRRRVLTLSKYCLQCYHGGHFSCMKKWWSNGKICPAGCGCM